ncbi:hypothetical protein BKI52_08435 [marine bacterium AO1-C]|nr:hypothetical protein BKI52_08435 [marine bacterium AO1-C]
MSSNNNTNSEETETYNLIGELSNQYADLGETTQGFIKAQKLKGEKTVNDWFQVLQDMLTFKYQSRTISSKNKLKKPQSPQVLIRSFFYVSIVQIAIVWAIVEHLIYPLSWEFWQYGLIVIGLSLLITFVRKTISKSKIHQLREGFEQYQLYNKEFTTIRSAESRILPVYNNFLHPMLAFTKEEMPPNGMLNLYFDVGHWKLPYHKVEGKDPMANRHVTHTDFYEMKVFEALGKLANGTLLNLAIQKSVRVRNIRKVNPRGKVKHKTKSRYKLIYEVRLGFPAAAFQLRDNRPLPISNVKMKVASNEKRHTIKMQQVVTAANFDKTIQHKTLINLMALAYQCIESK